MMCDQPNNSGEDPGVTQAGDSQDILAKAARSIFTASPTEMSSPIVGGFYNPAHDDNPLLIDTSVAEADEESTSSSSPLKGLTTPNCTSASDHSKVAEQKQQQLIHHQEQQQRLLRQHHEEELKRLEQQERQEQEKLVQQQREQHEQLMRHLEQQHQIDLASPQSAVLVRKSFL